MPPYKGNKQILAMLIRAVARAYVEHLHKGGNPQDIKALVKNVVYSMVHRC